MPRTKPASVLPTPEANWPKAPALQVCCEWRENEWECVCVGGRQAERGKV